MTWTWSNVGFVTAQHGGQAVHLLDDGTLLRHQIVGWITQQELDYDDARDESRRDPDTVPPMRIVAGVMEDGFVTPVTEDASFWYVSLPGDPDPTPEVIAREIKSRARLRDLAQGRRDKAIA